MSLFYPRTRPRRSLLALRHLLPYSNCSAFLNKRPTQAIVLLAWHRPACGHTRPFRLEWAWLLRFVQRSAKAHPTQVDLPWTGPRPGWGRKFRKKAGATGRRSPRAQKGEANGKLVERPPTKKNKRENRSEEPRTYFFGVYFYREQAAHGLNVRKVP